MSDLIDFCVHFEDCEVDDNVEELRDEFYDRVLEELDVIVGRPFAIAHFYDTPDPNSVEFRAEFRDCDVGGVSRLIGNIARDVFGCEVSEVRPVG